MSRLPLPSESLLLAEEPMEAEILRQRSPINALKMPLATTCRGVTIPSPGTLGWEGPAYKALV